MKKVGYVYYDADCSNGDDRNVLFRCADGVTSDGVALSVFLAHCPELVYDAIADLGDIVCRGDFIDAVADFQRGNVKFWVNVILTDTGVQVSSACEELDSCGDLSSDLRDFSDYLHDMNFSPAFSSDDDIPF